MRLEIGLDVEFFQVFYICLWYLVSKQFSVINGWKACLLLLFTKLYQSKNLKRWRFIQSIKQTGAVTSNSQNYVPANAYIRKGYSS